MAHGDCVSRAATDAEWAAAQSEWSDGDAARLAEMGRISSLIYSLPGVARPSSPSRVANAHPNQSFSRVEPPRPSDQYLSLDRAVSAARDRLLGLAEGMVDDRVLDAATLARAKQDATASLLSALGAFAVFDERLARERVSAWRSEPLLWRVMKRGASGDLEAHLEAWVLR